MIYQVLDDQNHVHRIDGRDPEHACARVADLHQVTVVAWRPTQDPQDAIHIYTGGEIIQ